MEVDALLSRKTEHPVGIRSKNERLKSIYARQFEELTPLRRHICARIPLEQVKQIFEPGCGTGLLGSKLKTLTNALYTGMDIDSEILPNTEDFVTGDAEKDPRKADIYVSSFFFSSLKNPLKWLRKVRKKLSSGGLFVVFAEYDYSLIGELPDSGISDSLRSGLEKDGINTTHGSHLESFFERAGFRKLEGGEVVSSLQQPDRNFLQMHIESLPKVLPNMSWQIVWGIWRKS